MSVQFEINKELISFIATASGMRAGLLAKELGVSTKALRMYRDGTYMPRSAKVRAKIQKLAHKCGAGEFLKSATAELPELPEAYPEPLFEQTDAPEETPVTEQEDDREFSPKNLRAFETQMGLNGKKAAEYVGVDSSIWYKWRTGAIYPRKQAAVTKLRKALVGKTATAKKVANFTPEARAKGGRTVIAADKLHDFAKTFRDTYQPRIDEAYVDYLLTHTTSKFEIDRRTLRVAMAAVMLVLKDRMSAQEIFELLSRHS